MPGKERAIMYFPEEFLPVCSSIGLITISMLLFALLRLIYELFKVHVISRFFDHNLKSFGQWALVTGGSSGIGKEYAYQLAKQGMDIIIVSNELEALKSTAIEIEVRYGVRCCFFHVDFANDEHVYQQLDNYLKGKNIGILINCAGILGNLPCRFLNESQKNVVTMIDLHIKAVVQMTRIILPSMLAKKKGIIVNVSSMSSVLPIPSYNVYSSCKAFSSSFTRAISYENGLNLHIQTLTPYFVLTRMVKHLSHEFPAKICILSADELVANAIRTITFSNYTSGYWINDISRWGLENIVPRVLRPLIFNIILGKNYLD